jgi:hypothetical protein
MPFFQVGYMRQITASSPRPDPAAVFGALAPFMGVVLVWAVLMVAGYCALYVAAVDAVAGRPVSMARAWLAVVRPRWLGTLVLSWLAFMGGMLCCILPGIYVGLLLSFALAVMTEEGVFGTAALRRSAELARYNPTGQFGEDPRFQVFLVAFVGWIISYVVSFVVQLPFIVVQQVLMFRSVASGQKVDPVELMSRLAWLQVPGTVLGMLAQVAVQLYVAFGLALVYFGVRRRREGIDLEAAIESLGQRSPEPLP